MKYRIILILLLVLRFNTEINASLTWDLQGKTYTVDTLSHAVIGPGTTRTTLALDGAVKLKVFYTTTDMENPNVNLKLIMGKDNIKSYVTVPAMPASHDDSENIYFAGVNSDFIGGMGPVGTTVANGELYKSYKGTGWYAVGIDKDKKLYSGSPYTTFRMVSPNAGQASIKAVNNTRSSNELILYTSRLGSSTGTSGTGVEVGAVAVDGHLKSDGTTKMRVVTAPVKNSGNMNIPENGFVLSGTGFTADIIAKMQLGEEFEVTPTIYFDNVVKTGITEMSGGCPMILQAGKILETQGLLDHLSNREPRTAIGYNTDARKVILLVVDGRQPGVSVGVPSKDLAAILQNLGCTDALNFDGGGSSTLWVKEEGVCNVPSEGSLRAVKNGMFVTTPATTDNTVSTIRFADYVGKVEYNSYYTPVIYGYNVNDVLVDKDVKDVTFTCDPSLGIIENNKLLCNGSGTHALTASLGGISASIPVTVIGGGSVEDVRKGMKTTLYPNPVEAGSNVYITVDGEAVVSLYTSGGQLIGRLEYDNVDVPAALPTGELMPGFYLVNVTKENSNSVIKLLIK